MKLIKKLIITNIIVMLLPLITNAESTYKFEIKINNFNVNNLTGIFDIYNGQIKSITMANGWENKTGLNKDFYFTAPKVLTGSYLVATVEVINYGNSYYQIKDLTYHRLTCQQDKYGSYYDNNGTKVNYENYSKNCFPTLPSVPTLPNLKNLTLSYGTLTPQFNKDITNYNLTVPYEVSNITLNGTPELSTMQVSGDINCRLNVGSNNCKLLVTNEVNQSKTYTVVVNRLQKSTPITNDSITDFQIINASLTRDFNQNVIEYDLNVPDNVDKIYFKFKKNGGEYITRACDLSHGPTKCLLTIPFMNSKPITYIFNLNSSSENNSQVIPSVNNTKPSQTERPLVNNEEKLEENTEEEKVEQIIPSIPDTEPKELIQEDIQIDSKKSYLALKIFGSIAILGIIICLGYFGLKKIKHPRRFFV